MSRSGNFNTPPRQTTGMDKDTFTKAIGNVTGISPSRADEAYRHYQNAQQTTNDTVPVEVTGLLLAAHDYHEHGDHEYAAKYVKRALKLVE